MKEGSDDAILVFPVLAPPPPPRRDAKAEFQRRGREKKRLESDELSISSRPQLNRTQRPLNAPTLSAT